MLRSTDWDRKHKVILLSKLIELHSNIWKVTVTNCSSIIGCFSFSSTASCIPRLSYIDTALIFPNMKVWHWEQSLRPYVCIHWDMMSFLWPLAAINTCSWITNSRMFTIYVESLRHEEQKVIFIGCWHRFIHYIDIRLNLIWCWHSSNCVSWTGIWRRESRADRGPLGCTPLNVGLHWVSLTTTGGRPWRECVPGVVTRVRSYVIPDLQLSERVSSGK